MFAGSDIVSFSHLLSYQPSVKLGVANRPNMLTHFVETKKLKWLILLIDACGADLLIISQAKETEKMYK